jgi:NADPH-ferrihemoprotein reductase
MLELELVLPIVLAVLIIIVTVVILKQKSTRSGEIETKKKEEDSRPKITYGPVYIYFGSQTGTAANFCNILAAEATKNCFEPIVEDLADFEPETFVTRKVSLFCMATHGEGEPTANSKDFYTWLSDAERTNTTISGMKFSVFGLGKRQYQFYNAMGKNTDKFLEALGGDRVFNYGEGNDEGTLEDEFNEWKADLWKELQSKIPSEPIDPTKPQQNPNALPFEAHLTKDVQEIDLDNLQLNSEEKVYQFQMKQYLQGTTCPVSLIKELKQTNEFGSALHVEYDLSGQNIAYKTAYNLAVFPENDDETVAKLAHALGYDLTDKITIEENKEISARIKFKHPIPTPISVKTYLTRFADVQGIIKKKALKEVAEFIQEPEAKKKYLYLASNEGKFEFEEKVTKQYKTLFDIITENRIKVPITQFIRLVPPMTQRYYTIASSNLVHPTKVHLCVSISQFSTPTGEKRYGQCSGYFTRMQRELQNGNKLKSRLVAKESSFILPADISQPVIMIGPGAGLAPFRGFLQEKEFLHESKTNTTFGETTLLFGCRKRTSDYLYKEELESYVDKQIVQKLLLAFSREQDTKNYVQDVLTQNGPEIGKFLFEQKGTLYICGAIKMGESVKKALSKIAAAHFKINLIQSQIRIEEMEKNKKIIKELWE